MYTSGSTGIPKGVGITHRNVVGFVKAANYAHLDAEETFLHLAPISFDASTFEIWAALLNGARLVIYPPTIPSLSELGEIVARTQVTTLFLTTGLFHQFVDSNVTNIGAVRQLLTGGDALNPSLLEKGTGADRKRLDYKLLWPNRVDGDGLRVSGRTSSPDDVRSDRAATFKHAALRHQREATRRYRRTR